MTRRPERRQMPWLGLPPMVVIKDAMDRHGLSYPADAVLAAYERRLYYTDAGVTRTWDAGDVAVVRQCIREAQYAWRLRCPV